jgi:hypothetical protein
MRSRSLLASLLGPVCLGAFSYCAMLSGGCSSSSSGAAATDGGTSDAGVGLTCGKLLSCDQPCNDNPCTDACYARATGVAQGLFNAFVSCIADNCPSSAGSPCASPNSMACSQCNESAGTGPCINLLLACESDKHAGPSDPDGGSVVTPDAGFVQDAASGVSCATIVTCQQACAQGDTGCQTSCLQKGTAAAQALDQALSNCVSGACPTTDGGACAMSGTTCSGCEEQAYYGACASQFSACESTDGGGGPVAVHGGTLTEIASGLDQPQVVIIQNGKAYTSEVTQTGPVLSVPIAGGTVSTILAGQSFPMGLAMDSTNAYVWNSGTFSGGSATNNGDGTVVQAPLAGGAVTTLASHMTVAYNAPYLNAVTQGAINAAPIGSTTSHVVYGSQPFPEAVATDGTNLYWANWGTFNAQGSYNNDGAILKAPVGGGTAPVTLASMQSAPGALALDGTNVYWTNIGQLTSGGLPMPGTGSVMQAPLAGGTPVTLATMQYVPLGIAVSGQTVYWAEFTLSAPGNIMSVPVGGGTAMTLVANVKDPFGIAVSGGSVYWTDNVPTGTGQGALYRLTP